MRELQRSASLRHSSRCVTRYAAQKGHLGCNRSRAARATRTVFPRACHMRPVASLYSACPGPRTGITEVSSWLQTAGCAWQLVQRRWLGTSAMLGLLVLGPASQKFQPRVKTETLAWRGAGDIVDSTT
ncbi:hypothetical protein K504DRAFT_466381 [Pleomassaria siparia CBS 279.74]|uniref:Uncharacterized protein n=1 Tax=Pleomassaria siparia CBS 279.74 TaxID=1314801 RepID=A0A6G1KBL5_9PLEO|nr:hypothetical protein K504DRAFT_466381 [Pleomassaria siparia CBS 279.74]